MVADTLESLRPKLTMYASLEQAVESLQKLNKEHQEQIGENVTPNNNNNNTNNNNNNNNSNYNNNILSQDWLNLEIQVLLSNLCTFFIDLLGGFVCYFIPLALCRLFTGLMVAMLVYTVLKLLKCPSESYWQELWESSWPAWLRHLY